jgi:hypothetical protein
MTHIKAFILALALVLGVVWAANSQPLYRGIPGGSNGLSQADITNTTANVANTSTTITLAAASRRIVIKTDPAAAVIYVDLANGTATSADFRIDPGASFVYEGEPISTFKYIGASATGTISVAAW